MIKVNYTQDPLKSIIELEDIHIKIIRERLYSEALESEVYELTEKHTTKSFVDCLTEAEQESERLLTYYKEACAESHCGDCIKVCCSCTKCFVEDILGLNTLEGFTHPYWIDKAFSDGRETLKEAIDWLKNTPVQQTWPGSEQYIELWQRQKEITLDELLVYKEKHFPRMGHEK